MKSKISHTLYKNDYSSASFDIPKVILVGGDHYNGLSLVRLFGKTGLNPYGIIIQSKNGSGFLRLSKYWKETWSIKSDREIIQTLFDNFSNDNMKPVIIPWSDGAASVIDSNLDLLTDHFVVPSLAGRQNCINDLMDKGKQIAFAAECMLEVANSFEIELNTYEERELVDIPLPCIGKPIISIAGEKQDIRKCDTREELKQYLCHLQKRNYERILLQEYVSIDIEYDVEGFVCGEYSAYFVSQKVRTWPVIGGPTSYAFSIDETAVNEVVDRIVTQLKSIGYSGLFDIELFKVGDRYLFNEINWRNSAVCFAAVEAGMPYPLYWYEAAIGRVPTISPSVEYGHKAMCELLDVHNAGNVGRLRWIRQLFQCNAYAYFDVIDMAPLYRKVSNRLFSKEHGRNWQ